MGNNNPTRNHYISEMLLRNFCDVDDRLWVGDKKKQEPYRTSLGNLFVISNLYTTTNCSQSVKTYNWSFAFCLLPGHA